MIPVLRLNFYTKVNKLGSCVACLCFYIFYGF